MASFIAEKIREERGDDVYVSVLFGVRRKERGRMVLNGEEERNPLKQKLKLSEEMRRCCCSSWIRWMGI